MDASFGFEGLHRVAGLLQGAGHEAADGVFLPFHLFHNFRERGAVVTLQQRHHLGRLAPRANRRGGLRLCARFSLRGFLGSGRLPARLGLARCALGRACARGGTRNLRRGGLSQILDVAPDPGDRGFWVL